MASLLSPRPSRTPLSLQATEPTEDRPDGPVDGAQPSWNWLLVAAAGAVVTAVAGWVLAAGMTVVGWVTSDPGTLADALVAGTELWLLGNGGGTALGGLSLTLVPLGFVVVIAFLISRCAGYAARRQSAGLLAVAGSGGSGVLSAAAVMTLAYLAPLMATALLLGHPFAAVRAAAVMSPVVALAAAFGSSRALDYRLTDRWPDWARALPRAVVAAQLVLVAAGTAVLVVVAAQQLGRIERLVQTLDAGPAGNIALLALQLAYAPNFILWAASYTLGAGFALGAGSVVAPTGTELGVLPALPVFGALTEGALSERMQLILLAGGLLAGLVAALVVVLARPGAGPVETTLVGGLAGVASGAVFTGLAWLSGGALGADRLADVGPSVLPLLPLACGTVGIGGIAGGLLLGLVRLVRRTLRKRRG